MKCPYQTKVIHKPEFINIESGKKDFAEDITEFSDCMRWECPFYYTRENRVSRITKEYCRRAESEG